MDLGGFIIVYYLSKYQRPVILQVLVHVLTPPSYYYYTAHGHGIDNYNIINYITFNIFLSLFDYHNMFLRYYSTIEKYHQRFGTYLYDIIIFMQLSESIQ